MIEKLRFANLKGGFPVRDFLSPTLRCGIDRMYSLKDCIYIQLIELLEALFQFSG